MRSRPATHLVVGFEYQEDARRFLAELRERFAKFGLELHPDKTRLIEFGRYAAERRAARGLGNVYAHYVFDLWAHQWRTRHAAR